MNKIVLVIAFVCVIPAMASAQERTERFPSHSKLSQLRVSFKDGTQKVERGVVQDSMVLLKGSRIPLSDLVMVEQSRSVADPLTQGIVVGAAVGILGAYAGSFSNHNTNIHTAKPTTLFRMFFWGVGCAFVGGSIDALVGNEKEWYAIWAGSQ